MTMVDSEKRITQAKKALEEADKRRRGEKNNNENMPKEIKGRGGLEPTRFGDWEVKGIASDF